MFPSTYFPKTYFAGSYWPPASGGVIPPPTPADLFAALFAVLTADADLTASMGRSDWLWHDLAPPGMVLPYAVWTDVSGTVDWENDPLLWVETGEFQIAVFDSSRTHARELARQIAGVIEAADALNSLTYSEATHLRIRRDGRGIDQLDPEKGPMGKDIWSYLVTYKLHAGSPDR